MALTSLTALYLDELGDLYDAETQMLRTLPRWAERAHAPDLRAALTGHSQRSRLHLERLQLIFTHWGEAASPRACAGIAGIVQEADERLTRHATQEMRDAAIVGAARRVEHYEIASYECVRSYALRLNRSDDVRLLQETLNEEGRAERRLAELDGSEFDDDRQPPSHLPVLCVDSEPL